MNTGSDPIKIALNKVATLFGKLSKALLGDLRRREVSDENETIQEKFTRLSGIALPEDSLRGHNDNVLPAKHPVRDFKYDPSGLSPAARQALRHLSRH